jgi:hypothetical protein
MVLVSRENEDCSSCKRHSKRNITVVATNKASSEKAITLCEKCWIKAITSIIENKEKK